jgi:4-amino-4-deoxy-L-arabinose transferase-like glycosyltransferase
MRTSEHTSEYGNTSFERVFLRSFFVPLFFVLWFFVLCSLVLLLLYDTMASCMADTSISQRSTARHGLIAGAVLLLTLLAAGLRMWQLDTIPAGLHFDEAAHGLMVQDHILRGKTPVFFSSYTGHEALFHYTLAPFLVVLGPEILALRLPAALWSCGLVPVVYLLGARFWGWRHGLLAALAVACGGWLVHIGRIGFRANTLPVVSGMAVMFLYQALFHQRRRDWLLSGALFGLSLYTYLAVRVLPLLAPLLLLYLLIWHRQTLRRSGRGIGLFTVALLIVATPLIVHMVRVPSDLFERVRQISVAEAQDVSRTQVIIQQTLATLGMFGMRGAENGFFNLPLRPVFPGIAVVPFYVGVLIALWQCRSLAYALTLLWLGVMLLPTILAADAPHWLRAIGAAPPAYLLWGLGLATAWEWLARRWRWGAAAGGAVAIACTLWWTQATAREYFEVWARRPELYYEYMQYATDAAHAAQQTPADDALLVSEEYYRHATYLFLAPRTHSAQWFDARHAVVWPRSAPWTAIISSSTPTTADIQPLLVQARGEPYAPNGLYGYVKLQGETVPAFEPPTRFNARFGSILDLVGIDIIGTPQPGGTLHVQLYQRALAGSEHELRIFVHLEDAQGRVLAQQDVLGYDAREWQAGDQFISFHDLKLPQTLPDGRIRLVAGLYDVVTEMRYPVHGMGAPGDFVELPLP